MKNEERSEDLVPENLCDSDIQNYSLRPKNFDEFIGQENLKANLKIFVKAAKVRKQAMDHVLFFGPPGLGKTTLAQIVANELEVNFKCTSGPVLLKSGDLAAILTNLKENDVLFIDEIHRINRLVEEVLYPAMEDFKLDLIIGQGPAARSIRMDLPPFTLVGATTRSGMLSSPMRDRFGIPLRLEFYSNDELEIIVKRNASLLNIEISNSGASEIAKRSRGTPRIASRLLRRVRDFAVVQGDAIIDQTVADNALSKLDIDKFGLDCLDRKYLRCIMDLYNGGPVGIDTLAAVLSEKKETVEEMIEPYIVQQGLVQRTSRGRCLSFEGFRYLGVEIPSQKCLSDDITSLDV